MRISFNWLKEFVQLPNSVSTREVAEKLKLSTVEVEDVTSAGAQLDNVVVGKVLSAEKHPNADKLKVCSVDIGGETAQIVCGGSNVAAGMLVAVAKVGAKVKWHGEVDLVELSPAKIRGVESFGMICGADEIGLIDRFPKKDEKEIVDLTALKFKPGTPLAEVFGGGDSILEIDNKSLSNRPDLWGHYGVAREVAALFQRAVKPYPIKPIKEGKEKLTIVVEAKERCPRYTALAMEGVTVAPSPAWLKERLEAVGLRSVNNIVDVTNYVMFETGEPLHAFDKKHVPEIRVRPAREGETITTLDGVERSLTSSMLVIANAEKPLAIAGIMGGEESGVVATTTAIVLEAATFNAANIRATSVALSLRSDSSARFEKSLDPNLTMVALAKAVELIVKVCPGARVTSKITAIGEPRLATGPLEVPFSFFEETIGHAIPAKTIVTILERLGFGVKQKKDNFFITIPTWRATRDIARAEDIVEEVVRIYGYENIPSSLPTFPIAPPAENTGRTLERLLADTLVKELAYTEVYNYSFVSGAQIDRLGDDKEKYLELDNPVSKEKPYIRRNLLPNLLENASAALAHRDEVKIFEIGKVFALGKPGPRAERNSDELLPRQDVWLTAICISKKKDTPFWEALRAAERIFGALKFSWKSAPADKVQSWEHPARLALASVQEKVVGLVHELHPRAATAFGLSARVGVCSINLSTLDEAMAVIAAKAYEPIPVFPDSTRDIAIVVPREAAHADLVKTIHAVSPLIQKVELFDSYSGQGVGKNEKSLAYHLTLRDAQKTLTTSEVDTAISAVVSSLSKKHSARVRE